ncbi:E-selectin-like [Sycon ciliatum]|uniref:E-selectin-like n=1 Tax=Sycon ciliatum TaxID=27933 RepID=UPI0031F67AC6
MFNAHYPGKWDDTECWRKLPFVCQRLVVKCNASAPVSGSVNVTSIHIGESVQYQCNTGYDLVGPATAHCTPQGSLTEMPICRVVVKCNVLAPVSGSVNVTSIHIGESVQYQCNTGYELVGPATAHCTPQGSLTEIPICLGWQRCDNVTDLDYLVFPSPTTKSQASQQCQSSSQGAEIAWPRNQAESDCLQR